jgi:Arc/MetJ-type ribon-helix-helix transcriptional regulator
MLVVLSPEMAELLQKVMASGKYPSETAALMEALHLLLARDRRLAELGSQLQLEQDQLKRGEFAEFDEAALNHLFEAPKQPDRRRPGKGQ